MSKKVRDFDKLAEQILQELDGEGNIINVSRCATRLRLHVQNVPPDAKERISRLPGVITVVAKGGQIQVVIGTNVDKVYEAFIKLVNMDKLHAGSQKESILNRVIATMSAVFAPFVYILAAAGIIQGLLILIKLFFPQFGDTGTYQVFSFISWSPFVFLPIFIAVTASKYFKCNVYIAIACCAALVSPGWAEIATLIKMGGSVNFIGIPLSETLYTSSVLPPLFLVWLLSYVEHFLDAKLPNVLRPLFVPLLCMLVMIPFTIVLIGPITAGSANFIANSYNGLVYLAPSLAGGLIGAVWQIFVIFGVHWGITPVVLANFEMYGHDSFQAFQTIAVVGQIGAVFGFYLKSKNHQMKGVSLSAFITGIFGITEPAIYGVNLRFKKPFIYGCISAMVGGIIAGFFTPYYFAYAGLPGPLTIVNAISPEFPESIIGISIGCLISFMGPILLIQIFGTGEKKRDSVEEEDQANIVFESVDIKSPMIGQVVPLIEVPDPVFAEKLMGEGVAILPSDNHVYAPFDGEVTVLFDQSKHAIGLVSNEGIELLIHVGTDTVTIKESLFTYHVVLNQKVKRGEKLMTFDAEGIKAAGCSLITPVIITNSFDYQQINLVENLSATIDSTILIVKQ